VQRGSAAPLCGKPPAFRPAPDPSSSSAQAERLSLPACAEEVLQDTCPSERRSLSAQQAAEPQVIAARIERNLDKPERRSPPGRTAFGPTGENGRSGQESPAARPSKLHHVIIAVLCFTIVSIIITCGINSRARITSVVAAETRELAVPTVSVIQPRGGDPQEEIVLPGNIQAFTDAPIYARTNGYLKRWYVDIGARVKTGELLAEIDTPEVDQQLQQARADLATAEANYQLAQTTAARYQYLLQTDSVAKQDVDNAVSDAKAKKAMVDSAEYNVKRLEQLQSFEKIYAPFDGVITARNTDVGQLIDSGSGTPAKELFHIAAINKLRVYVSVPQTDSRSALPGVEAGLTLAEFPQRHFKGTLVRNADAIDPASRTLLTEVDVNNPAGELLPGAYTEVHLKLPSTVSTFVLPVNTFLFRSEGLQVGVVREGKAELLPIVLGKDFGTEAEVISGLDGREQVIMNPPDSLVSGEAVRIARKDIGGGAR
jgi:RND family efflux transporter MFP subunit